MLLLRVIYHCLANHFSIAGSDPRTSHLPLVSSYANILLLLVGYVALSTKIGPAFMATRKPYNLKGPITVFNVAQILINIYIFLGLSHYYALHPKYSWLCMGRDKTDFTPATMNVLPFTYMYFLSKILDTLDTMFFVLRKKFNQVSFLHVYHHATMIWASFVYHNLFFGSIFTTVGGVNAFVHVLMYTYYMVSGLNTKLNLDAWKPRMTQLQIIQFLYYSIKFGVALVKSCSVPTFWLSVFFLQNLFMTAMFSNFYYKAYIVKRRKNKSLN